MQAAGTARWRGWQPGEAFVDSGKGARATANVRFQGSQPAATSLPVAKSTKFMDFKYDRVPARPRDKPVRLPPGLSKPELSAFRHLCGPACDSYPRDHHLLAAQL